MTGNSDWRRERLGSLLDAKYGKSLPEAKRTGGEVPVYGSNGVVGWHDEALTRGPTIVIGRKGSSGAVNSSESACWPIDTTYFIDDPGPFRIEFLDYLLRSLGLTQLDRSTAIPGLNRDQLYDIEVPVPPESEQMAIVSLLKAIGDHRLDADHRLTSARRTIDRFRRALLGAASSGRLTSDWRTSRPVDENTDELLAQHASKNADVTVNRRRVKPAHGLALLDMRDAFPESWSYRHLRELVELKAILDIQDGNHGDLYPRRTDFTSGKGVPFISAESVSDKIMLETAPRLKEEVARRLRIGFAHAGDVILTHNATVGRVAVLPAGAPNVVLSTSTTYYRVDPNALLPDYLVLFMRSHYFQQQLAAVMEQTTRNQVPVTKQVELYMAVPPIAEQKLIVDRASGLLNSAERLRSRVDTARVRVGRSSDAVLAKAFRGELQSTLGSDAT